MAHLTPRGFEILKQKLATLKKNRMELRSQRAASYISGGDGWHDNPEFQSIEVEERWLSVEIDRLEQEFAAAVVVPKSDSKDVGLGAKVEIAFPDGSRKTVEIGDTYTADPSRDVVSLESPLGKAVKGAKSGEQRTYKVGEREIRVRVISIT